MVAIDILYPTEEDLFVAEGWNHRRLSVMMGVMLRAQLGQQGWIVFGTLALWHGLPQLCD